MSSLPEEVIYYYTEPEQIEVDNISKEKLLVYKVFCSDASNGRTRKTGENWVKNAALVNTRINGVSSQTSKQTFEVREKNLPKRGLKIVKMDYRGNGGRAYKVVTPTNLLLDLREDTLMDVMQHAQINNGLIDADLVWAKVHNEMKLVRVDSPQYEQAKFDGVRAKAKPLDKMLYRPGHVYQKRTGKERFIYLGRGSWLNSSGDFWFSLYHSESIDYNPLHKDMNGYEHYVLYRVESKDIPVVMEIGYNGTTLQNLLDFGNQYFPTEPKIKTLNVE